MLSRYPEATAFVQAMKKKEVNARELYHGAYHTGAGKRIEANKPLTRALGEDDCLVQISELDQDDTEALVKAIGDDARAMCEHMNKHYNVSWRDVEKELNQ